MKHGTLLLAVLFITVPTGVLATRATVPDDHATIQAALDSRVDTVFVRSGTYPEAISASEHQRLLGAAGNPTLPAITSADVPALSGDLDEVKGLAFTGPVYLWGPDSVADCHMGAGLHIGMGGAAVLRNIVHGDLAVASGAAFYIYGNTVVGGTIDANPPGRCYVRGNTVLGPAAVGIHVCSDVTAESNYVRNCETGMVLSGFPSQEADAFRNVIEDCWGPGMTGTVHLLYENTIRRCGGHGMDLSAYGAARLSGNVVDSVGGTGIKVHATVPCFGGVGVPLTLDGNAIRRAGGAGIAVLIDDPCYPGDGGATAIVSSNRVIGSTTDGLVLDGGNLRVQGNVVGRSGGRGLVATGENATIRGNTLYLNGAAGIEASGMSSAAVDSIDHNIAHQNGVGLRWLGAGTGLLACNDWYANSTANTEGISPATSDWSVDPLFCDMLSDGVSLRADSPLLDAAGCGQIGALGQGCEGGSVGTLLVMFDAVVDGDGVRLRWQFGAPGAVRQVVIERAETETGPWMGLGLEARQDGEIVEALDTGVEPGRRYWYRLVVTLGDLTGMTFGPVVAELPGRVAVSGVSRIWPNPSRGETRIEYAVARQEAVRLSVVDVAGREVGQLAHGPMAPGRYTLVWDGRRSGSPVAAGLYFVRWQSPGRETSRPLVRLR